MIHHALYNDFDGPTGQNKDLLVEQLFGAESVVDGWTPNLVEYPIYSTDHGHFISTYGVTYDTHANEPDWNGNPLPISANRAFSRLPSLTITDELYTNFQFTGDVQLGREVNDITPLFSNSIAPANQFHTSGFTGYVDKNEDGISGRILYLQFGENRDNYDPQSVAGRIYRNGVVWLSLHDVNVDGGDGETPLALEEGGEILIYPNPASESVFIQSPEKSPVSIMDLSGRILKSGFTNDEIKISGLRSNLYIVQIRNEQGDVTTLKLLKK